MKQIESLAALWCHERGLSASRLGTLAAGDGALFDRIQRGRSCTVVTIERLLCFFRDPANWHPERGIPRPAQILLDALPAHADADSAADARASSGKNEIVTGAAA